MLSLLVVFALTGCVKQNVEMSIDKDGKVNMTIVSAIKKEYAAEGEEAIVSKKVLEEMGFKTETYDQDDYLGIKATKNYQLKDISKKEEILVHLEDIGSEDFHDEQLFQVKQDNFLGTRYKGHFIFEFSGVPTQTEQTEDSENSFEVSYKVTLPCKAKSHNADKVEGNTLIWNVTYGETKEIQYEFVMNDKSLYVYSGITVIAIALGVGIALYIRKKKAN